MNDLVEPLLKKNRGWPWPEDSYGLTPMFGEDGWCHHCGTPLRAQSGSLVLQSRGLSNPTGAWVPNWRFDVICVSSDVGRHLGDEFGIQLRDVEVRGNRQASVQQLVIPVGKQRWFDDNELRERTTARHGEAGRTCEQCGTWRWMPLMPDAMPPVDPSSVASEGPIVASPEVFGDGRKTFRLILASRALAEALVEASPRDFKVHEPQWASIER